MASPKHDLNHLKLSRKIFDSVGSAATDGVVTSALRNDYLNRANTFVQLFFRNRPDAENYLTGLVGVHTISDWSVAALPTDYSFHLRRATKNGTVDRRDIILPFVEPSIIPMVINRESQDYKNCFTVRGTSLYGYEDFSLIASGTGELYYIRNDQRTSAGDSSDILIDFMWHDALVDIAALYHFLDKGEIEFQKAEERMRELITMAMK